MTTAAAKLGVDMGTLLSLSKETTTALLGISELFIFISGIVLIVGLVGEKKTPWWKLRYDLFLTLVAVGCAGELAGDAGVFVLSNHLQTIWNSELKDAVTKAGDAKTSADSATKDASRAKDAADKAEIASSGAVTLAQSAHREADSAIKNIREASGQLTLLRTDTKALEAKANKIKSDLIDLAVCNSPRVITPWEFGLGKISSGYHLASEGKLGKTYVDSLSPMAGQVVLIEFVPDAEARRAAFNIAQTLNDAKWKVQVPLKPVDFLEDGVAVQPSMSFPPEDAIPHMPVYWHVNEAVDTLVNFLHSYNWQARRGWPVDAQGKPIRDPKTLPEGTIRIQVGLYPPAVYVSPPGQEELKASLEKMKIERERMLDKPRREREAQLAKFPPEFRKQLEELDKEADAARSKQMSNGPCQILNPFF